MTAGYREFPPPPDLAAHVACTWSYVVGPPAEPQPIIPDGCADLIALDDAMPHVAAPTATTQWVALPAVRIVAIRFRPGAVRSILRCDVAELGPWGAGVDDVCGAAGLRLQAALRGAADGAARRRAFEAWTRERLAVAASDDRRVIAAAARLTASAHARVAAATAEVGLSPRQAHRAFVAACGYGPKTLQRIMRVQRVLRVVAADPRRSLAEAALTAGFADQAHLTRDFRAVTGFSPRTYLHRLDPDVGRWLDR